MVNCACGSNKRCKDYSGETDRELVSGQVNQFESRDH